MSAATHIGRETAIDALGRKWTMGRWTRSVWADLLEWARPRIPDPLAVAEKAIARFPASMHDSIVRHAIDLSSAYLSIGSPEVARCVASLEGMAHLMYLLLRPAHPGVTEDEAFDVLLDLGQEKAKAAFDRAAGKTPPAAEGNVSAPAA